jgi:hypothetical protein
MSNIYRLNRRQFLKTGATFLGAGLLQPVLPLIGAGKDASAAYPEEILSIEKFTHGKVKPGDVINKDNADLVKTIAPEGLYAELLQGREIKIAEANLKPQALVPVPWVDATLKNQGQAILDQKGQLWAKNGQPWIGGYPFPKANTALEAMWNHFFNYFGLDDSFTITKEAIVDHSGSLLRSSDVVSVNIQPLGRVAVDPIPVDENFKEYLFRTSVVLLSPFDDFGTSVMNSVYYDGAKLPTTDGYIPTLKRVRKFPSNDRFDPVGPYSAGTVSEYYVQGDPLLTWSWDLVDRKPLLGPSPDNIGGRANEQGKKADDFVHAYSEAKYPRSTWELRPEILVIDGTCHIEGCPYSKKRVYYDSIYGRAQVADIYDKANKLWKFIVFYFGDTGSKDKAGNSIPCRSGIVFADVQNDYHDNIFDFNELNGQKFSANTGLRINDWLTPGALQRQALK